ncbi:MAG: enoyl-CoA hydratase/isomerase family protein [Burkholderiaceae bacterium]
MSDEDLLVADAGDVLTLTVNRPEKFNPLSRGVLGGIRRTLLDAASREALKAVVIRGAGNRYFAAGGDLRDLADVRTDAQTLAMVEECRGVLDAVRECPVPVVAVLNGDAIGGGAELAVACDFRIMRDGANIGYVHGRLQITSAWGGGTDLFTLVGRARALRMATSAELVPARTALDWGLADAVFTEDELDAGVQAFLAPMLARTPRVLRACKANAIAARRGLPYDERRGIEADGLVRTWTHDDHWAAVDRVLAPKKEKR